MRDATSTITTVLSTLLLVAAGACTGSAGDPGPAGAAGPAGPAGPAGNPSAADASASPGSACVADHVDLPGTSFYPEGIAAAKDGTLFVGSLATGEIVRATACGETKTFAKASAPTGAAVGLWVDEGRGALWACTSDATFQAPAVLVGYKLSDGSTIAKHPFPKLSFCNDLVQRADGTILATDSIGHAIYTLPGADLTKDGAPLTSWLEDPSFVVPQGQFGLNGLALPDDQTLFFVTFASGKLFKVAIGADGKAGTLQPITLPRPLENADGLELLPSKDLLVVEGSRQTLSKIVVTGTTAMVTPVVSRLDQPTTHVVVGNDVWIAEGQFSYLFGGPDAGTPHLPFRAVRVALPQ